MTDFPWVPDNTILLAFVGSSAHGLHLEGQDDRDLMGVCIEPPEYVIGLEHFEQEVYRTQPEGARSGPGDTDRVIYSARKYCRLALGGNPTVLLALYAPVSRIENIGRELLRMAPAFASKKAGRAFLGYMTQQRQRLTGERGQMAVNRPELIAAHGYDTKYAMHMLRLGYQGVEYLTTGKLTLPMAEPNRSFVFSVRTGEHDLNTVLTRAGELERELEDLLHSTPLPDEPERSRVNDWLVGAYEEWWELKAEEADDER